MVTKEELEKSTFIGRNANVWFMTAWALMMFIIDGVVYAVDPPPGESKWGYGPTVFLLCLVRHRETNERRLDGRIETRPRKTREREQRMAIRAMRRRKRRGGRIETRTRTRPRARDRARFTKRRREGRRETTRGESGESFANHSRRLTVNDASKRAQIASFLWGAVSIRKTERAHRGELTRLRETKTLAELMSLNMGA